MVDVESQRRCYSRNLEYMSGPSPSPDMETHSKLRPAWTVAEHESTLLSNESLFKESDEMESTLPYKASLT